MNSRRSYLTLLSSRNYLEGVLVLDNSLKHVRSIYPLRVVISPEFLRQNDDVEKILKERKISCIILKDSFRLPEKVIEKIYSRRWINTFDKLQVFGLTSFEKVVFLDSDMLAVRNIDHLFECPHLSFATASEQVSGYESWILPNTGMMVIEPEEELPEKIFAIWPKVHSKKQDFSDQDLIHEYYKSSFVRNQKWRIPALYNCFVFLIDKVVKERNYNLQVKDPDPKTIAVLHFAIKDRPWMMNRKQLLKFYLSRIFTLKIQELKAYMLYFHHLSAIR